MSVWLKNVEERQRQIQNRYKGITTHYPDFKSSVREPSLTHTTPTLTVSKKKKKFLHILEREPPLHFILTQEVWKQCSNKVRLPVHVYYFHTVFDGFGGRSATWSHGINFIKSLGSTPCSATAGCTAGDFEQVDFRRTVPRVSAPVTCRNTATPGVGRMLRGDTSTACKVPQKTKSCLQDRCHRGAPAATGTRFSDFIFIFHFVFFCPSSQLWALPSSLF